ncbi:MAG: alpha/beta hydrolase [Porticoccaceae bacterium]|nr:alpha/beta hydrolase [Porticoccaceae bacterium]
MASNSLIKQTINDQNIDILTGGSGDPLVIIHHDIGNSGWLPFYDRLAETYTVYIPSLPGFDTSDRPEWMRSVRDLATVCQWLLREMNLGTQPYLVGLGFGGWIAAEMATTTYDSIRAMSLVNPMGLQPREGEIMDQFLVSSEEYIRTGFNDLTAYHATFGDLPDVEQLVAWEINREMTTRIAWKPYMFDRALENLLRAVTTPAQLIAGVNNKIVPPICCQQFAELIPGSAVFHINECGHYADIEKPEELAKLILDFNQYAG